MEKRKLVNNDLNGKKTKQLKGEVVSLRKELELCAKNSDIEKTIQLYQNGSEFNYYMYQLVLNICGNSDELVFAEKVFEDLKRSKFQATETCYSAMIKLYSKLERVEEAFKLIDEMEILKVYPKLRTFSELLVQCCKRKDMDLAMKVVKLVDGNEMELGEKEYVEIFKLCIVVKDEMVKERFLKRFLKKIMVPDRSSWSVLKEMFPGFNIGTVDGDSGVCEKTGEVLQSIDITDEQYEVLVKQVDSLVCTTKERIVQWNAFKNWLNKNDDFEVILDGANIGYYNQNYNGGGFTYKQIEKVIDYFKGKKVLLVLHEGRTTDRAVPCGNREMVKKWKSSGIMYCCTKGNNDDWYWLYAALVSKRNDIRIVSNDLMRDHHFQMLTDKSFSIWKERHQTKFHIYYDKQGMHLEINQPRTFSWRSQKIKDRYYFPAKESQEWLSTKV